MHSATMNVPFSFNSNGQVNSTSDPRVIWKNRVLMVLLTRFGERVMRPNFGSDIHDVLFEAESVAVDLATRTINIAFNTWLTALNLIEITPEYDATTGFLDISLIYSLPSGETDSLTIKAAIFSRSGDLIQEITNG